MKKIVVLLLGVFSFVCCKESEPVGKETSTFLTSYVVGYYDCPLAIFEPPYWRDPISLEKSLQSGGSYYGSPDLGSTGSGAARFVELSERNGDRSYNREEPFSMYTSRNACADNFVAVHVVCPNKAWDESHPAGSSLNDLVRIQYWTYAPYVESGYVGSPVQGGRKLLTDLKEDDLRFITPSVSLHFDSHPLSGKYDVEVRMVTTDGIEKKAVCTIDFDKQWPDWAL